MSDLILEHIKASRDLKAAILEDAHLIGTLRSIVALLVDTFRGGNKVLFAGNGGSAADAQHLAAELVGRFAVERPGLAAIALTTDSSVLTATGNDYSYEVVFSRQVEAIGKPGDVLVVLSTSGRSPNVLKALAAAKARGVVTVGLTGANRGEMEALCDHCIAVPSTSTPRIQEAHITVGHALCAAVEEALFVKGQR